MSTQVSTKVETIVRSVQSRCSLTVKLVDAVICGAWIYLTDDGEELELTQDELEALYLAIADVHEALKEFGGL